jgi:SpoIVB peptidase S55
MLSAMSGLSREMGRRAARLLLVAATAWVGALHAHATEIMPPDQVKPGMVGVGRTVFSGMRIEEFRVEVIGTLENVGPKQSLILARLSGGPLAETGVIAGMSGSPVFIDGKLVGAVSYGFPFSKETIAGITPIGEMIDATQNPSPRAASTRFPLRMGVNGPALPLDRSSLLAALRRPWAEVNPDVAGWHGGPLTPGLMSATLRPLALPLVFSGFDSSSFDWARGVFSGFGFAPLQGSAAAMPPAVTLPPLEPGSAVGVSLIEGDFDLSVTGTVTHVDGDRVYAFGHPFYNLGPTQFPMKKAYVYSVFPSLYQSWKISAATEPVGTLDQDRATAVAGHIGASPRMLPVELTLKSSRAPERRFQFRVVEDDLLSPVLTYVGLLSALQGYERAFGTATVKVEATLTLDSGQRVAVEDVFADEQPALHASALVAAPLAYLMNNEFERVRPARLDVRVSSFETQQSASLQRIWLDRAGPLRAGDALAIKIRLRTYRGELRTESVPLVLPKSAPPGEYTLLVADADTFDQLEQRELRQPFVPHTLDQLVRAINGLRKKNHVYVRLLRATPGAIVGGEYMPGLPPSVLAVLGTRDSNNTPLRTATMWELDLPLDDAVSGARTLTVTVTR